MLNLVTSKLTRDSECRRVLVIVYRPVRDIFISYGKDLSECTARRIFGLEFRVLGFGFRDQGLGFFRVQGLGFSVQGLGFRV